MVPPFARNTSRTVVLLPAANHVREVIRGRHPVELGGTVILRGPRLPAVERYVGAAIVRIDHPVRVARGDPQIVVVAVGHGDLAERLAAVARAVEARVEGVHDLGVLGIGVHPGVVERPLPQAPFIIDQGPCRAGIVGTEDSAILMLHDGPHAMRRRR